MHREQGRWRIALTPRSRMLGAFCFTQCSASRVALQEQFEKAIDDVARQPDSCGRGWESALCACKVPAWNAQRVLTRMQSASVASQERRTRVGVQALIGATGWTASPLNATGVVS